jgi:hypothetical protein
MFARILPIALIAVGVGVLTAPQAHAKIIDYTFSPDASWTFSDGAVETLAGSFTFDSSDDQVIAANVSISGADLNDDYITSDGLIYFHPGYEIPVQTIPKGIGGGCAACSDGDVIYVDFIYDLELGQPDPLSLTTVDGGNACELTVDGSSIECPPVSVSGEVDPAPVPEPITLSLFGAGLAGAAAMRRRNKANKA